MTNHVLVVNSGSSSLKFAIINTEDGQCVFEGIAECLGTPDAIVKFKAPEKIKFKISNGAHQEALTVLLPYISHLNIVACGHRVVHGGEYFKKSVIVTEDVIEKIAELAQFAPLHNMAHIVGIRAAMTAYPDAIQTVTFDTAFHATMPEEAYHYAIPKHYYEEHSVRRYGMHGTSHLIVSERAASLLERPINELNMITAHLGNGCSATAIKCGQSVDTTMGMTPLEGLVMGTRSGDIDPGVIQHICHLNNWDIDRALELLNKESGLLGISGLSNDCRTLEDAAQEGHKGAQLAMEIFCYRLAKQIAALTTPLERLDALVFTGGIGENSDIIRARVIERLNILGLTLNQEENRKACFGATGRIDNGTGPTILVIPTDEEFVIARDAMALLESI